MSRSARLLLLASLCGGVFLVGIELLVTAVALPYIVQDLADWTELRRASWMVNGYFLTSIATMPIAGRAADRFGLPPLFAISLGIFALGSALAGAAQGLDWLIAARVLQGIGGGAVIPLATAGASHLFAGDARARALGLVGALTFLGMAAGPFFGAAVLDAFDLSATLGTGGQTAQQLADYLAPAWRWIFYLTVPLAVLAALYTWAAGPDWPRPERRGGLDLLGAVLFTTALAAGLLAVTTAGGEQRPFFGLGPPELAAIGAVAAVAAGVRLLKTREPFLDLRAFTDRTFAGAVLLSLLTGYSFATAIIGGSVFVDRVHYGGPAEQRVVLGALAGAVALGAFVSGLALRFVGPVLVSLIGLVAAAGGLGLLVRSDPATSTVLLTGALAAFGLGFGLTVTPRSAAAVEALGRRAYGMASASVTVARYIGMAIGVAALTALGSNRIEALSVVVRDQAARDAVLPAELRGRPLQDGLVVDALERWAAGQAASILAGLFLVAAAVVVAAAIPALLMRAGPRARDGAAGVAV